MRERKFFNFLVALTLQPKQGGSDAFLCFWCCSPSVLLRDLNRWERSSNFYKNEVESIVSLIKWRRGNFFNFLKVEHTLKRGRETLFFMIYAAPSLKIEREEQQFKFNSTVNLGRVSNFCILWREIQIWILHKIWSVSWLWIFQKRVQHS